MIRQLINYLNYHTNLYNAGKPEITDQEWDNKYMMLRDLEKTTGIIYPDSPTQHIEYETKAGLNKYRHEKYPMLSLDKTKSIDEFTKWCGDHIVVLMGKMDGLSCKVIYRNGELVLAATRGDGEVGEDITHNAKVIANLPKHIATADEVIVSGEVVCDGYSFAEFAEEFKNQRNFAAGAIRLLDSRESASRHLSFYAWDYLNSPVETFTERLQALGRMGFTITPARQVNSVEDIESTILAIREECSNVQLPIDGIVARYNDIAYGESLGETAHHPNHSFAFKFEDEIAETVLEDIEYEPSRNGIMTPVAVFKPIELLGSTVSRASVFNLTIMRQVLGEHPWRGQKLRIIKSNMIIPQIIWAEKDNENVDDEDCIHICDTCSYCGGPLTVISSESGVETLVCNNELCPCRLSNRLDYFCGKSGFDIKGLSKATLEKLNDWGWVTNLADIFSLATHRNEWIQKPGFGAKSVDKILEAINTSKKIDLAHFIAAFGITGIGLNVAKELCKHIGTLSEFYQIMDGTIDCTEWDGFGRAKRNAIMLANVDEIEQVARCVEIIESTDKDMVENIGLSVVITGKLKAGSRANVKKQYEAWGVKVLDSVSSKTNYLIANAPETSAKYKKAQELNIPIVTEDEFVFEILKK